MIWMEDHFGTSVMELCPDVPVRFSKTTWWTSNSSKILSWLFFKARFKIFKSFCLDLCGTFFWTHCDFQHGFLANSKSNGCGDGPGQLFVPCCGGTPASERSTSTKRPRHKNLSHQKLRWLYTHNIGDYTWLYMVIHYITNNDSIVFTIIECITMYNHVYHVKKRGYTWLYTHNIGDYHGWSRKILGKNSRSQPGVVIPMSCNSCENMVSDHESGTYVTYLW